MIIVKDSPAKYQHDIWPENNKIRKKEFDKDECPASL